MIGAASEFGKLGLTAIGNSRAQVEELYGLTLAVLDHETSWGRRPGGSEPEPEPQLR